MSSPSTFFDLILPEYMKGISDAVIQDNELFAALNEKGRIKYGGGGNGYEFRVRTGTANIGGAATDWDTGSPRTINPYKTCVARYRPYIWRLLMNTMQQDRAEGAPSASVIAEPEKEDLNVIQQEATQRLGVHMYGDGSTLSTGDVTGATPMAGLEYIILASGTYFGLARATYTALNSQLVTCANPSQWDNGLINNLVRDTDQCYVQCTGGTSPDNGSISKDLAQAKDEPDLIITTQTLFQVWRQSFFPQNQYTGGTANPVKALQYGNAKVTYDTFCTANRLYVLNSKHLQVKVVKNQLVRVLPKRQLLSPLADAYPIVAQAQMHSKDPRKLGKVTTTGT